MDAYGNQDLFTHCPGFLKEGGSFVTVGVAFSDYTYMSMLWAIACMMKNLTWPWVLGGIPRKYAQVAAVPILQGLEELKELCEKGELKVPVDSCWGLENALKVRELRLK
jgi:hypothetical protein